MTKLSQLKIDPEFQNQINPPSFEETHQLEMNILKEERILNPIITWNGYIVDGHAPNERKMAHPINLSLITVASTARCNVGKNAISTSKFRKKF